VRSVSSKRQLFPLSGFSVRLSGHVSSSWIEAISSRFLKGRGVFRIPSCSFSLQPSPPSFPQGESHRRIPPGSTRIPSVAGPGEASPVGPPPTALQPLKFPSSPACRAGVNQDRSNGSVGDPRRSGQGSREVGRLSCLITGCAHKNPTQTGRPDHGMLSCRWRCRCSHQGRERCSFSGFSSPQRSPAH